MALARRYNLPYVDISRSGRRALCRPARPCAPERSAPRRSRSSTTGCESSCSNPADIHGIDELRPGDQVRHRPLRLQPRGPHRPGGRPDCAACRRFSRRRSRLLDEIAYVSRRRRGGAGGGGRVSPSARLVNSIIMQAAGDDAASDIHFEPQEEVAGSSASGWTARSPRLSGSPKRMARGVTTLLRGAPPISTSPSGASRKTGGSRSTRDQWGGGLDIRVAVLPTVDGEKIVMRLIDKSRKTPTLESLGLSEVMRQKIGEIIRKPTGALLVTGPTGAARRCRSMLPANAQRRRATCVGRRPGRNPVGRHQPGMCATSPGSLCRRVAAFMRQDPDVIMVGEIRDAETAEVAVKAAQTGHLVLSTLHTNDAPAAANPTHGRWESSSSWSARPCPRLSSAARPEALHQPVARCMSAYSKLSWPRPDHARGGSATRRDCA